MLYIHTSDFSKALVGKVFESGKILTYAVSFSDLKNEKIYKNGYTLSIIFEIS